MTQKHGVLIDPFARTIKVVEYGDGNDNLSDWYRLMGCECIDMRDMGEHPTHKGTRLSLVCDDEGLYNQGHKQRFFQMRGYPHMLAGKCLIVATRAPDTVEMKDPEVVVDMLIRFSIVNWQHERLRFRDITTAEDTYDHPAFGKMARITQTPHFSMATDEEIAAEEQAAYAAGEAAGNRIMDELEAQARAEGVSIGEVVAPRNKGEGH